MLNTAIRNSNLFCLNCGGEHRIDYPITPDKLSELVEAFNVLHKDCVQTWTEPKYNNSDDIYKRAMRWIAVGEKGMSSEAMWGCFMGSGVPKTAHPYDPDDFKRCYKLLEAVPEWKSEMHKLKSLSREWSNLVDNWDKLTEMFERNVREDWKNYKEIGMYEFMQTLIEPPKP